MVHDEFKDMIPTYVLSALDAEENHALGEHLSQCEECRRELENWQTTAAMLSLDAKPMEPSPEVREKIMSAVRSESGQKVSESNVIPFNHSRGLQRRNFSSVWAIAASILLLIGVGSIFVFWQQNRNAQRQIAELAKQLNDTRAELDQSRRIVQLMMTPGARMNELAGTPQAPEANAKIAYDKTGHAMLMVHGLPAAPTGKEYQLWFIVGNKKIPGRSFAPDTNGTGMLEDRIPESARDSAVFAITLEPKGGVETPTGAIYLVSSL
jgi:anti-sigma-K factor RskA